MSVQPRRNSGFTLIETLVSMVVFSIAVLSVTTLATTLQDAQRTNDYLIKAIQASKITVELYRNNFASNLPCGGPAISITPNLETSGLVNATGQLAVSCVDGVYGLKRIDVSVKYDIGSVRKEVQTSTYVGNGGLYQ